MSEPRFVSSSFDYDAMDAQTRQFVQQKAHEIHGLLKRTAEHVLLIGQNLKAVKEQLPHGQFLPWVETEFGMSRWTAQRFIHVADKLAGKWCNYHHLPLSVLYELAAPSTSEEILTQVQDGQIAPTLDAVKEAKEAECLAKLAEQQARSEAEQAHRQLATVREQTQEKQATIERLTHEITHLQEHIATLSSAQVEIREVEKYVVPPEVKAQLESLQQRLRTLTQQREALARQVAQLTEEARAAAFKRGEGEQGQRIRLRWYKVTSEFQSSVTRLLSQWPSPLDTQAFEADDWTRLSQTKEAARRFLDECSALTQSRVVDSTPVTTNERAR